MLYRLVTGGGNSNVFYFQSYLGFHDPNFNLTNIFQMGLFNHQLLVVVIYIYIVIIFIFMTLLAFETSLSCIDGGS